MQIKQTLGLWLLGASLVGTCLPTRAAQPYQEYRKQVESAQTITALTDDLMGDSVSLYNGATEFTATDISLPGNNVLPVQLKRRFSIEITPGGSPGSSAGDPNLHGAGNWDVEVPYISGVYGPAAWESARCTNGANPSVPAPLDVTDVWQGNTVHVPGAGDRKMLKRVWTDIPQPSDGIERKWTTRERDMFTCIPMQSGLAGEGFLMQTASGLRYYFDKATTRYAGYMTYQPGEGMLAGSVNRTKYYLLASKIVDRFGNTVTFTYNTNGSPTSIASSDGRIIVLTYVGTLLDTATVHDNVSGIDRTWVYDYGTGAETGMLKMVTQPDGSKWQYAHVGTLFPDDGGVWDGGSGSNCGIKPPAVPANFSFTVTHPSGAIGTFQFANKRQPRSGVHANACVDRLVQSNGTWVHTFKLYIANYFDVMALTQKNITGPGVAAQTWTYEYPFGTGALWGARGQDVPYPCTTCPSEKTVTVHEPGNITKEYRYGYMYASNEGRLLGTSTIDASGTVLSFESTEYLPESAASGQNFYPLYGQGFGLDDPSTLAVRPVIKQTIVQDGVTFTMQVNTACTGGSGVYCFDIYGNPTKVTKFSSLPSGYSRTEQTAYFDQTAKWILGQTKSVTCTAPASCAGMVISQTDYDLTSAVPLKTHSFGKLQQTLTYYTGSTASQLGTVASASDGRDTSGFNTTVLLSNWKGGTPQTITYPATTDQPTAMSQSALIDDNGWIRSITDENHYKTCYDYDPMGRIKTITYPSETVLDTCAANSPWAITTSLFEQTISSDDDYGIPGGHWRQTVSTGNGRKVVYFDAFWRPLVEEAYDNANASNTRSLTVKRYNLRGKPDFQSYPLRTLGSYALTTLTGIHTGYDALDRVTSTNQDSEAGPLTTTTKYDGFMTEVTDPLHYKTTTQYQAFDQPVMNAPVNIAMPENAITDIVRDVFGKPTLIQRHDPDNTIKLKRNYVYDANQQLCKTIEPESGAASVATGSTVLHYDAAGNVDWSASGQNLPSTTTCDTSSVPIAELVTRSYDARNRGKTLMFPDNLGNTTTTYTPDGLVASLLVDNGGSDLVTTDYTYKRRRLLASETLHIDGNTWSLGYAYNGNGQLATLTYPDGLGVDFLPNGLGQPTKAGIYALGVTYFPNGGMSGFTYGNGIVHTLTQNTRQLPEQSKDSGGVLDDTYDYDPSGNVLAITDGLSSHRGDRDMTYDGLNRLKTTTSPMFTGGTLYEYNVLDDLTRVKAPGRDHLYSYNTKRQLQTVNNTSDGLGVIGLGYDTHGNLNNKNGQSFIFDAGNRLREAVGLETYLYDGQGRRVKATHPTQGAIYSLYGQDGALRSQRDERQGKATDYIMLNGSLVARVSDIVSPAVPTLSAPSFVSTGSYTVTWTTMAGASRYELQEHLNSGSWAQVYSGTASSKAFTGKASGVYGYQARACNASACGGWSAETSVSVTLPPSSVPTLTVPATAPNGNYTVSWTASTGATSYTLDESANGGSTWTNAYTGAALSKAYTAKAAGSYTYRVKGCNASGCSGYSATKTVQSIQPPTAIPTLTVPASNTTGSYTVSWTAVATSTSYTLEEQVGSGAWTAFGANASTSTPISGRANGSYSYRVKGCNSAGCGPVSAIKTVTVLHPPAAAPTVTVPASSNTGSYTVSWTAVVTTTSYEVQESANGGNWTAFYTGTALSKVVSGKPTGSYRYQGRACNASGCSAYSAIDTIAVSLAPVAAPTLTAPTSTTTGNFTVSWTTVTDAATYTLEERLNAGTWGQAYSNTGTSIALTNRTPGTWDYRVKGCNPVGCGPYSAIKSVTSTVPPPPPAPTGLQIVPNGVGCNISWNGSTGATYYELKRTFVLYSGPMTIYNMDSACPANPGVMHVRACNATTCSAWVP